MNAPRASLRLPCALVIAALLAVPVFAGGSIGLTASGQPLRWPDGGRNIVFRTDLGGLGPLTNAQAVAQTVSAFQQWESIPTATVTFVNGGPLDIDVDETNFTQFFSSFGALDALHAVIYDRDGAIFDLLFGPGSAVWGLTGIAVDPNTGDVDGDILLNGAAMLEQGPAGMVTPDQFAAVQVHEIGHFVGLDHSVVNGELATIGDEAGPTPHATFPLPPSPVGLIETMYPFTLPGTGQETPDLDDRAILSTLYPEPGFLSQTGSISGRILGLDGRTPLNGINVIARNVADPFRDAVSAISGNLAATDDPRDTFAGRYRLTGLTPGARYAVYVDEISLGGFSRSPRFGLPGPEEFYNGAAESSDPDRDDPSQFTALRPVAGRALTGIDIVFNRLRPGPIPLDAFTGGERPHGWAEILLPFRFTLCGQSFDTAFINATDGSLTFGVPESAYITFMDRPLRTFLTGPPRIAGLMAALDPYSFDRGTLSFSQTSDTLTLQYTDVPTVFENQTAGGSNTFSITLRARTPVHENLVTLAYDYTRAEDAIVGYSCGSRVTSGYEHESDLSAVAGGLVRGQGRAAVFEEFAGQTTDLDQRAVTFEMPGAFTDAFEPNNSRTRARRVTLPFDTAASFAEITPGDIDFYRFRARAGEILVAETTAGGRPFEALDTLLGVFGPQGAPLAVNDDLTYFLPSSRLIFPVPADGEYTVAVTTYPDFGFTGAGAASGRYVLTLDTYRGTILPLDGDDVTTELPLGFAFPFQGSTWSHVWVSSNGNLTFGAPEVVQRIEDLRREGFLAGPPRIAPFLTDLDPSGSYNYGVTGFVIAESQRDSLTVHWVSVPKIFDFDTTTFSATLHSSGCIRMSWGAALGEDRGYVGTLVGITEGAGVADPGPTDLSALRDAPGSGTIYEQFAGVQIWNGANITRASDVPSLDLSFDRLRLGGACP